MISRAADTQSWVMRRSRIAGIDAVKAAENRLASQVRTDSTLVSATESAASTLAAAYVRLIEEASALPTHPFAPEDGTTLSQSERYRQERAMIEAKAETMRKATEGLRELIETAQHVGLLKVDRGGKSPDGDAHERDKPIDLSKLTQLNIAIVQARGQAPQVVARLDSEAPVEVSGEVSDVR